MEGILAHRVDYLQRIWKLRYFWFSLVRNDLHNRYKHSFFGVGWSLLRPLAMTCIFCLVFGKLFGVPVSVFAPYLLIGMTTWQFFTESLITGCHTFARSSAYIKQQRVPLAIFSLRTVLGSGFHSIIALAMAITISLCFRMFSDMPPVLPGEMIATPYDPFALLYLIPACALLFVLGWFLATISGVAYTYFPDTVHLLEIALQILFYVTPIIYMPGQMENRARLTAVLTWNPLTSVLALVRTPVWLGRAPELSEVTMSLAFVTVVGIVAVWLLRKTERTLVFWI